MEAILERLDKIEDTLSRQAKERWLNIKGVSDYTSLSIPKIRRSIAKGELQVSKNGGRLLFKVSWVDKWLKD